MVKMLKTMYLLVNLLGNILNEDCPLNAGGVLPGPNKPLAVIWVGGSQLSGFLISLAESHLSRRLIVLILLIVRTLGRG